MKHNSGRTTNEHESTRRRGPRRPSGPDAQLVSAVAGAREKGIPYTSLRDAAFRGEIPVVRLGRAWYFDRRDLDRFIQNSKIVMGQE